MSHSAEALKTELKLKDLIEKIKYDRKFRKEHPEYFDPDGLMVFCGGQGSGKTLSAVKYIDKLCQIYPNVVVVSNIKLDLVHYDKEIIEYQSIEELSKMDNGYAGIICFIDEIQTEFSSLESKSIHPSVIATISQQRKRRLHVVGTSQLFKRIAKPWREQCNVVVDCGCILGFLVKNYVVDFGSIAEDENGNLTTYEYNEHHFFFKGPRLYSMYDTYERVSRKGGGR